MGDAADKMTREQQLALFALCKKVFPLLDPVDDLIQMAPPYFILPQKCVKPKVHMLISNLSSHDGQQEVESKMMRSADHFLPVLEVFLKGYSSDDLLKLLMLFYGYSYAQGTSVSCSDLFVAHLQAMASFILVDRGVMKEETIKEVTYVQRLNLFKIVSVFSAALTTTSPLNRFIALLLVLARTCFEFLRQVKDQVTTAVKTSFNTFSAGLFDRSGYKAISPACAAAAVELTPVC